MIPAIYSLVPKSYCKKVHKSHEECQDVEQFSKELEKKAVNCWNYKFEIDKSSGSGYKIKFDQFEKKFLKKSDFVIYIVNSVSKPSFKNSIEKLVKSCKDLKKLNKVLVISLCPQSFEELNNTPIEVIYFGEDWQTEFPNHQWESLEDTLKNKINVLSQDESTMTKSLTIPRSNNGRKSPSRIKTFFYSLPTRFEADKRGGLYSHKSEKIAENTMSEENIKVPNINITNPVNIDDINDQHSTEPKHKVDFSKLSLNSLFRKRSKKTRESGLSINSSTSNGSSRKSDISKNCDSLSADVLYDVKQTSSNNQPHIIFTSNLKKTEKYKARIEFFKSKANKVIKSTSCLQSPNFKRSKCHIADGMDKVVHFSSAIITAASDIGKETNETILRRKNLSLLNNKCRSETLSEKFDHINSDIGIYKKIKYYSWNEGSNEEEEFIIDQLKCNDLELNENVDKNSFNENINDFEKMSAEFENLNENMSNDDENVADYQDVFEISNDEFIYKDDEFDRNYVESDFSYSTFIPQQALESVDNLKNSTEYSSNLLKLCDDDDDYNVDDDETSNIIDNEDPVESLNELIKSIKESCEEIQTNKKAKEHNEMTNSINEKDIIDNVSELNQCSFDICDETVPSKSVTFELDKQEERTDAEVTDAEEIFEKDESISLMNSQIEQIHSHHEMSPELIAVGESLTHSYNSTNSVGITYNSLIRNPFIVYGLFTTTALTAPFWSIYMPRNVYLPKVIYRILDYFFYNGILQSIPNQIIEGRQNYTFSGSNTIKRLLILLPSSPWSKSQI